MSSDTPSPPKQSEMIDNDLNKQPPQSAQSIESTGGNSIFVTQVVEKDYAWKEEQENILKKWADKALCFKMMHEKAHKRYWCLNAWFNIPIIIISTITGTGNFASGNFITGSNYFIFALGALNLFGGILATIATYTGVAQKLEAHRFSSIGWDKFTRRIQIELAKSRKDRVKARDFIRQSAEEYDRLIEMSPILPNDIVSWFTKLIRTDRDESLNSPWSCCYDWFCFACGCNTNCCCPIKETNTNNLKSQWDEIEVPEIVGRIRPTQIAPVQNQNNLNSTQKMVTFRSDVNPQRSQSTSDLKKPEDFNQSQIQPIEFMNKRLSSKYTPVQTFTQSNQSYAQSTQPYRQSTQQYTQPNQPFTQSNQPFTQSNQQYTQSSQQYAQSTQPFTSTQQYTSTQPFTQFAQQYTSAQPITQSTQQYIQQSAQPNNDSFKFNQYSPEPMVQLNKPIRIQENNTENNYGIEMKNINRSKVIVDNNTQTNLQSAFESEKPQYIVKLQELSDSSIENHTDDSDNHSQHTDYTI